jgi:hypothetical protein
VSGMATADGHSGRCWLWTAGCDDKGNGQITVMTDSGWRPVKAPRAAFFLSRGFWPDQACHHCDNPPCVNPDHIFNGTRSDNIRDSMSKGRMNFIARTERSLAAAYQRSKTHCAQVRHLNCAIGNVVVVMVTFVAEARAVSTKGRKIKEKKNRIPKSCLRSTVWARFQKGHGQK